jgi:hypothetical protein
MRATSGTPAVSAVKKASSPMRTAAGPSPAFPAIDVMARKYGRAEAF